MIKEIKDIGWVDISDNMFIVIGYNDNRFELSYRHSQSEINHQYRMPKIIGYRFCVSDVWRIVLRVKRQIMDGVGWQKGKVNKVAVLRGLRG